LEPTPRKYKRIGLRQHFHVTPWTNFVEVHCATNGQAYVTPVGSDEVGVVLLGSAREFSFDNLESNFPSLGAKLRGAQPRSALRGAPTGIMRLPSVTRDNVALIGDASATIDAISGDGLALAFHQAVALGEALQNGDLKKYDTRHRQICRAPFLMARLLLMVAGHEGLCKLAVKTLSSRPRALDGLLAAHVNEKPPLAASLDIVTLGFGMLTELTRRRRQ
jgi:flavin-dependent dehydrogenase